MYYDVNNLYGWAIYQPLPYSKFQWVKEAANFDVSAIMDSFTDYILEVDFEYPQHLHDNTLIYRSVQFADKSPGKHEAKLLAM